jgi:hypothetical protein
MARLSQVAQAPPCIRWMQRAIISLMPMIMPPTVAQN